MNYRFTVFFILIWCLTGFSQIKQDFIFGEVRNSTDGQFIADVNIVLKDSTAIFTTVTDANGKFKFPKTTLSKKAKLEMSCIGFETAIFNNANQKTFYLKEKVEVLNTVLIQKNANKMSLTESLFPYERNLGFNEIAANYIEYNFSKKDRIIKNLKYEVIDIDGIKNLKYLPFKANIYSIDTISGLPKDKLISLDVLAKKINNKKWVKVDVSKYKIKIPKDGVFVAFIVLSNKDYKTEFVEGKHGVIQAVPCLKFKRHRDLKKKSFLGKTLISDNGLSYFVWEREKYANFEIEVEYEK